MWADGTTYYFAVAACNAAGDLSRLSAEVSGVSPTAGGGGGGNGGKTRRKAKAPKNLSASIRDDSLIDLSWQASEDLVSAYRVELGTRPNRTDISSFTTAVTTSVTIGDLPINSNKYYVRVRGVDARIAVLKPTIVMGVHSMDSLTQVIRRPVAASQPRNTTCSC
jgi:Fibronectin type III domain